ncbi:MAG: hypothetical protein KatS3mg005_0637 [Bryobacteraceae bacterium]|nr:MAG: hypothetical protein KatS3mg005_0637 [Bryobacteraceae bacterium]
MTPDACLSSGWPELAGRLRSAAELAERSAREAPPGAAAGLLQGLQEIAACLEEAERLCRRGERSGAGPFLEELERWAGAIPALQSWVGVSAALAAGWAAAAGVGAAYGPGDPPPGAPAPGAVNAVG